MRPASNRTAAAAQTVPFRNHCKIAIPQLSFIQPFPPPHKTRKAALSPCYNFPSYPYIRVKAMASSMTPRFFARSARQLCRHQQCAAAGARRGAAAFVQAKRFASTKHPKGFEPPTQGELEELRERVQEFTSMLTSDTRMRYEPMLTLCKRERDTTGSRPEDGSRQ